MSLVFVDLIAPESSKKRSLSQLIAEATEEGISLHIMGEDDTTGGYTEQAARLALDKLKREPTWNPDTHYAKVQAMYQSVPILDEAGKPILGEDGKPTFQNVRVMTPERKKRGEDTTVQNPACTLRVFKRTAAEVASILEARKTRTEAEAASKAAAGKLKTQTA